MQSAKMKEPNYGPEIGGRNLDRLILMIQYHALKITPSCVKNATKTKIDLRDHPLAGLSLSTPNNAFSRSVALSHVLDNGLK